MRNNKLKMLDKKNMFPRVKIFYIIFLLFFSVVFNAQNERKKFCDDFFKASVKNKIKLASNLEPDVLKDIYPIIKDSLEKAKKLVYAKSASQEGKLLVDIIDANLELAKKNYVKAVFIIENGIQYRATNIVDSLRCYSILKSCFIKIRNYIKAYEVNARLELLRIRKPDTLIVNFGVNKSSLFALLNFYPEAIKERRNEFAKLHTVNDTDALASLYNDVGVYFNRQHNSDSAEVCFLKAKEVLTTLKYPADKKTHYEFFKALIGGNLGFSYYNKGNIAKAIPLLKEDIYFSLRYNDYGSAFNSYNLMVECLLKQNNKPLAKKYLDSAENLITLHLSDVSQSLKFLYLKSTFYQAQGDYDRSIKYLNKYFSLKDSLTQLEKVQGLLNTEIAFKIEEREFELKQKNKILEQKNLDDANHKTFRAYQLAGILVLLAIVIFLMMRNRFFKKRELDLSQKNEKINLQNAQIEQSLKEKEILIKEIHHRVKNNLQIITSMLSLQITKEAGKEAESILMDAKQRINAIALTHQMLYQNSNLSQIPINQYVESLVRQIESSFPPTGIKLITELYADNRKINIDNAVPLGLLINELLTNSFKHAFPDNKNGIITVSVSENETFCSIKIKDNGIGLPGDFKSGAKNSIGMDLIHILSEQIEANLKIKNDNGSEFILEIPKAKLFI